MTVKLILPLCLWRSGALAEKTIEMPDALPPGPFTIRTYIGKHAIERSIAAVLWDEQEQRWEWTLNDLKLNVPERPSIPRTNDERIAETLLGSESGWEMTD